MKPVKKMQFVKSLKIGKEAEKVFMKYLVDYPDMVSLEFSKWRCKDYDIKMVTKDKEITYEVKSDRRSEETGNCCIECKYKWQDSWIYWSKADYIVYYSDKKRRIQEREALIQWIKDNPPQETHWGDGGWSKLYLYPVERLPEMFLQIPELPELTSLDEIKQANL